LFGDGTWLVPDDVAPGTYWTLGYMENCYWTRLRGFESGLADIIASRIGAGPQIVTIGVDDAGFDSVGCGGWTNEDWGPPMTGGSILEFRDGTYMVNEEFAPARVTAEFGESCSWERLSGFGGTRRERIERGFAEDGVPPTVTIERTDVGFTSSGCGTWTPAGE
jgi:hypothetical protein